MNMVDETDPPGSLIMNEEELEVFVRAFEKSGFTGPVNWYRNFTRNWERSAGLPQRIDGIPCLMITAELDAVRADLDASALFRAEFDAEGGVLYRYLPPAQP